MTATGTLTVPAGRYAKDELTIPVRILDTREAYGRTNVLVEPVGGQGRAWVSGDRVKVTGEGE